MCVHNQQKVKAWPNNSGHLGGGSCSCRDSNPRAPPRDQHMKYRYVPPPSYMHNLPFSFGSVDSSHLQISPSFIDKLRFYHVGMSKQFARRLGTHFRYGLVWCVSIARNFRAQMRFIWWWPSKLWRAPCACCAWLVFNSLSLSPSGCTHVAWLRL